jgi:hypothetical protein
MPIVRNRGMHNKRMYQFQSRDEVALFQGYINDVNAEGMAYSGL